MKTKIIVFLISVAAVSSLLYSFIYYGSEENIPLNKKFFVDQNIKNEINRQLLYGIEQQNKFSSKLENTSLVSSNVISGSGRSYAVHIPIVNVPGINCPALFSGDIDAIIQAHLHQERFPKQRISDDTYVKATTDCTLYRTQRRFIMQPLLSEEATFSLAFSIVMFRDVELFERLLRAIYRPQNFYCVHVDKKSALTVHRAVAAIASCFTNVFIAPRVVDVYWGTFTVLESELICMETLLAFSKKWQYFINLTGQEFPLKTNWDIVKILKVFRGANNIEGTVKRLLFTSTVHFIILSLFYKYEYICIFKNFIILFR